MTETISVRRVGAHEAAQCIDGLADVLIDCVAGGASVSFMWPLARDKADAFWQMVSAGVERGERALLVARQVDAVRLQVGVAVGA